MSLYKGMIAYSVLRLGCSLIRLAIWSVPDVVFGLLGLLIGLMALLCIVNRKVILLQVVYVVMHVDVLVTVADLITLSVILNKVVSWLERRHSESRQVRPHLHRTVHAYRRSGFWPDVGFCTPAAHVVLDVDAEVATHG